VSESPSTLIGQSSFLDLTALLYGPFPIIWSIMSTNPPVKQTGFDDAAKTPRAQSPLNFHLFPNHPTEENPSDKNARRRRQATSGSRRNEERIKSTKQAEATPADQGSAACWWVSPGCFLSRNFVSNMVEIRHAEDEGKRWKERLPTKHIASALPPATAPPHQCLGFLGCTSRPSSRSVGQRWACRAGERGV
jgi:hypothetical protein